ncbi:MAG: NAD(P)-binding domain-containing protein [Rhizobium sp.]|uniref:pyrroline-5-carboxylate reductase family protein n=1 Tax=Rhizobium sp. SYY.PMSO TaxID=3382192 RepID=UPI0013B0196F
MIVGILGVGHLAASLLAGLKRAGLPSKSILLSPRGRSGELAALYDLEICADVRDLVHRSDLVLLAVRPQDAPAAVDGLAWRPEQVLISVCAGVRLSSLPAGPARLVRAMPLTAAEINASPTVFFPDIPEARWLIEQVGPAIALRSEREFEIATVNAAIYGWAQTLVKQSAEWCAAHGTDPQTMRQLVAQTFVGAGRLIAEKDQPMEDMLAELVTPGGITELGLKVLGERGQPDAWRDACDAVLARLTG